MPVGNMIGPQLCQHSIVSVKCLSTKCFSTKRHGATPSIGFQKILHSDIFSTTKLLVLSYKKFFG